MSRPLIPFTLSYIYGIVAAELFRYFPVTVSLVSLFLVVMVIFYERRNPPLPPFRKGGITIIGISKGEIKVAIIVIVAVAGFFYMLYDSRIPPDDVSHYASGEKMTLIGLIDEPPGFSSTKASAHVRITKISKEEEEFEVSGRVKLNIYDPEVLLSYGDIIRFTGRLKAIRGFKNPGLFDYSKYVARQGIRASVSVGKSGNISKIGIGGNPVLRKIYGWREEVRRAIRRGLTGPSSAILQAMVIGVEEDLTPEVRDQFTAAGVTHILSISGSHLGFVTFLVFFTIRYLLIHLPYRMLCRMSLYIIPSKIAALATFPPVIFYALISGGEIATVRSLIMALVCLTAIVIEREGDTANTLIVAALLALLWDPQALFDISFQLSYMAVFSMIIVAHRFYDGMGYEDEQNWAERYRRRFKMLMLLTIGATVSTGPIVAHYYNQVTWAGLVSNMVIVPYVGFAVLPVGLLTSLFTLVSHTDVIPLAWFNDLLLRLFYKGVRLFAELPLAMIYTPSPGIPFIVSIYAFLLSLLFLKKQKKQWARIFFLASILVITLSVGCNALARDGKGVMRVTFLDVGQGDSALIEFPEGEVMVIDGGGTFSETFDMGRSVLAPYLWNHGIRRIDYVVSTHPQMDHVEGLTFIAEVFDIGEVWTNGTKGSAARGFYDAVQRRGIREVAVYRGMEERTIGGCNISFLNPPVPNGQRKINDLSIVIRVACSDISLLFTGDIESEGMREVAAAGLPMASRVIKVPHHGSRGSVEDGFISAVRPDIAVISAGYQNSYHHPSEEAISAYKSAGASVYRTDQDGAVTIEAKGGMLQIRRYEDRAFKRADFNDWRSMVRTEAQNFQKMKEGLIHGS